jgi:hypothetical protein
VGILARLTKVALIVWERLFDARSHRRPQLLIPNTTKFTFSSESKGNNKFCDLIMSLTYAIAADASLLDAAEKWTKCSIEIAK